MTTGHQQGPVSIGLFGVNERSQKVLEVLFSMHAKGRYRLTANEAPQVAIVDMDGTDANKLWSDYRSRYPTLPTIVISFRAVEHPDAVSLKKPIAAQALLEALGSFSYAAPNPQHHEAKKDVAASTVVLAEPADEPQPDLPVPEEKPRPELVLHIGGTAQLDTTRSATAALEDAQDDSDACGDSDEDEIDLRDPRLWHRAYYNPENNFQKVCQQTMHLAMQTAQIQMFTLEGLPHPILFVPEHGGQVVTRLQGKRLRFFCLVQLTEAASVTVSVPGLPADLMEFPGIPFSRFLWEITLWSSRGHLPDGTPLDIPLRLKHWPNFTRLMETPHAMRIAALWSRKPYSLLRTCQELGVPQRYVFAFFSATNSAGLIEWRPGDNESAAPLLGFEHHDEQDRRQNAEPRAHDRAQGNRRGLLGRILSHLKPKR